MIPIKDNNQNKIEQWIRFLILLSETEVPLWLLFLYYVKLRNCFSFNIFHIFKSYGWDVFSVLERRKYHPNLSLATMECIGTCAHFYFTHICYSMIILTDNQKWFGFMVTIVGYLIPNSIYSFKLDISDL